MNRADAIVLSSEERMTLETWSRARSLPARLVQRARIIQMAAEGALNQTIAHFEGFPTYSATLA
jgi:hypothetical protein